MTDLLDQTIPTRGANLRVFSCLVPMRRCFDKNEVCSLSGSFPSRYNRHLDAFTPLQSAVHMSSIGLA